MKIDKCWKYIGCGEENIQIIYQNEEVIILQVNYLKGQIQENSLEETEEANNLK